MESMLLLTKNNVYMIVYTILKEPHIKFLDVSSRALTTMGYNLVHCQVT